MAAPRSSLECRWKTRCLGGSLKQNIVGEFSQESGACAAPGQAAIRTEGYWLLARASAVLGNSVAPCRLLRLSLKNRARDSLKPVRMGDPLGSGLSSRM
jgi:hypothetical protein